MILKPLELSQMTGRSCIPVRHVRSRSFLHDNGSEVEDLLGMWIDK